MATHRTVLVTLLTLWSFIAGCPQAKLEPTEPNKVETLDMKIYEPDSNEVEPVATRLPNDEPQKLEPNDVELTKIEPSEDKFFTVEPNEVEFSAVEPNDVKRVVGEPNEVELTTAEPNDVEPNDVEFVTFVTGVSFHDKCADILKNFVGEDGMVDYQTLRRKRLKLKKLLDEFDRLDPNEYESWPEADKIAFWINAYNIQMLDIIVRNYPIKSSRWFRLMWSPTDIRHIPPIGVIGVSKWDQYKFMVMDEEFTLAEIEQRFFHQEFDDPRIYFAISYASLSSPFLRNEPYYGYKLNEQLQDQTKRFLSSPRGFKIDRNKQAVYLSAMFQPTWHGKKFVDRFGTDKKFKEQQPTTRAVLNFITNYVSDQDVSFLEVGNYSVRYIKYDWTLNDSSRTR